MLEYILYLLILVYAVLGGPIYAVMSLFSIVAFVYTDTELTAIANEMYQKISTNPNLVTIPLFTFAGYLMAESKSSSRLLKLAQASLGWLPGGVPIVSLVLCAFFTAFTGASGVTIIALGGLLFPMLVKEKYSEDFSLGLITTSGSLGLLFPPSLPIILYGIVASTAIDQLFLAGIIPGIILILILSGYSIYKTDKIQRHPFQLQEFLTSMYEARYEIPIPFLIVGGIYGGFITPSEASAISAFYVLIMVCFLYKDLNIFKDVPNIAKESMSLVGAIMLILSCAFALTNYLVTEDIPQTILEYMEETISNKYVFLFCLNIFLLVVGAIMDIFSAIIIVVPIIIPIADAFGINPIHLAIIFLTNLEIGYITPPVGINLFISSYRFKVPVLRLYKVVIPYFFLLFIALMLITYIPELSLLWVSN